MIRAGGVLWDLHRSAYSYMIKWGHFGFDVQVLRNKTHQHIHLPPTYLSTKF